MNQDQITSEMLYHEMVEWEKNQFLEAFSDEAGQKAIRENPITKETVVRKLQQFYQLSKQVGTVR